MTEPFGDYRKHCRLCHNQLLLFYTVNTVVYLQNTIEKKKKIKSENKNTKGNNVSNFKYK